LPEDGYGGCHFLQVEEGLRRNGVAEIRHLKQLEEENAKLKRLVADLTLDKSMLQDALRKKWGSPSPVAKSSGIIRVSSPYQRDGRAKRWALGGPLTATGRGAIRHWSCGYG
jgi:hypothetical protein